MKVVIDTNVIVSALLNSEGLPRKAIRTLIDSDAELFTTDHLRNELLRVLFKEKVRSILKRNGTQNDALAFLARFERRLQFIPAVTPNYNWLPSDPADNWVIQCAVSAGADLIITGDYALLALGKVGRISITTVRDFLSQSGR